MIVSNVVEVHTGREVAIYNNGGTTLKSINLHGNGLIGYVNKVNNNRYYYVKDHLGSIRQVIYKIAAWANDNIVASKNYQPYGSIIAEYNSGTDYRYDFTMKQRDKETDFNYFGTRYYDSGIGRWTTVDPLAHLRPGLSPYHYAQNNPLNRFDPDGMIDWPKVFGGAAVIIGGAFQIGGGMSFAIGTGGLGAVGGLAVAGFGVTNIAFGTANLIDGFKDEQKEIPTGLFDAIGGETLGKKGAIAGKILDAGTSMIGSSSPLQNIRNMNKLLPASAREAKVLI